ncbi:HD domain-containing protein [Neptunicoccus cionae]|uniref:HD domain-containing protein n=1 Tax=Neptunicoccus cionae TaxID=2035344 RepID=UPI001C608288|nr:HD domain-containing protein [Amylibacter cionae]
MATATHTLYMSELRRVWAGQKDSAHDLAHVKRVWHNCQTIAQAEGADLRVLHPAALFHDIINPPKSSPKRAEASYLSANYAAQYLKTTRYPAALLENVHHSIHAHSYSANIRPKTLEAQVLQDADRLDALGAIGIARCFAVSGQLGRTLFHPTDPMAKQRELDESTYALDHFQTKLFGIAETLCTPTARAMAAERVNFMQSFCATLTGEAC